jgi:hypothetical protein
MAFVITVDMNKLGSFQLVSCIYMVNTCIDWFHSHPYNMPLPHNIMFLQRIRSELQERKINLKNIHKVEYQNVVLHMCTTNTAQSTEEWSLYGVKGSAVNTRKQWSDEELKEFSSTDLDSPFRHTCLLITGQHGKTLLFRDGNGIRAGKYTVAHGALNARRLGSFINRNNNYTAMSTPNSVVCGSFRRPLDESIKHTFKTTANEKFPGVSVTLRNQITKCTPELYTGRNSRTDIQRRSKFIAPGFKSVGELAGCLEEIDDLSVKHALAPVAPKPKPKRKRARTKTKCPRIIKK